MAAALSLLFPLCLLGGLPAWFRFRRRYPELREFRYLGLATFLTGGLALLGSWLYLLTDVARIKKDPLLRDWLFRPLMLWGSTFVVTLVLHLFSDAHFSHGCQRLLGNVDAGAGLWMLVRGWKSTDELIRLSSRRALQFALWGAAGVVLFFCCDLQHYGFHIMLSFTGLLGLAVCLSVGSYLFVQQLLSVLVASTRSSARPRNSLWLPLSVAGVASVMLPFLATWVHMALA